MPARYTPVMKGIRIPPLSKVMFINQIFKIVQIVQICGDCPEGRWSTSRLR